MKVSEKVSFAKFFPESQQYIVIRGSASSPSDYNMSVSIGDGENKTSFYLDPWSGKDPAAILRSMREAMQQALEFYERTMNLPAITSKDSGFDLWKDLREDLLQADKPAKKKPAAKKKAAPKK